MVGFIMLHEPDLPRARCRIGRMRKKAKQTPCKAFRKSIRPPFMDYSIEAGEPISTARTYNNRYRRVPTAVRS